MRPGYIYFAETSTPFIKVGRFFSHLSVAQKEASYRRLDPGFTICHTYPCADVVAEEKRVLSMLRLVAGTAVTGAGRECFDLSVKSAVAQAAAVSPAEQAAVARAMVMAHTIGPDSVQALIDRANRGGVREFAQSALALHKVGIALASGGESIGGAVDAYATVVDSKSLKKAIPALKKLALELDGFALF